MLRYEAAPASEGMPPRWSPRKPPGPTYEGNARGYLCRSMRWLRVRVQEAKAWRAFRKAML